MKIRDYDNCIVALREYLDLVNSKYIKDLRAFDNKAYWEYKILLTSNEQITTRTLKQNLSIEELRSLEHKRITYCALKTLSKYGTISNSHGPTHILTLSDNTQIKLTLI